MSARSVSLTALPRIFEAIYIDIVTKVIPLRVAVPPKQGDRQQLRSKGEQLLYITKTFCSVGGYILLNFPPYVAQRSSFSFFYVISTLVFLYSLHMHLVDN